MFGQTGFEVFPDASAVTTSVRQMPLDVLKSSYFHLIPSLLGFLFFTALAGFSAMRGRSNRLGIPFAAVCALAGLINIDIALVSFIQDKGLALKIDRLIYFLFVFSVPLYVRFIHVFLGIVRRWPEALALACSLMISALTPTDLFIADLNEYAFGRIAKPGPAYHLFIFEAGLAILYCLWLLIRAHGHTRDNHHRNRIKYVLGGMVLSALLLVFHYIPVSGVSVYSPGSLSFIPALILAIGVLKYDLLDMGALMRKGSTYLVLVGTLAAVNILIIYLFHSLFIHTGYVDSFLFPLISAVVIVLIFDPLKRKARSLISRFLFRGKYNYQQVLKDVSTKMTSLLNVEEIGDFLVRSISEAIPTESIHLFILDEERQKFYDCAVSNPPGIVIPSDHPFIRCIRNSTCPVSRSLTEKEKPPEREAVLRFLEQINSALAFPLSANERLNGFIALGEKKSGELFVPDDLEIIATIANQSAVAIENARNFGKVEDLNRNLEKKIQKRTADLAMALEEKDRTRDRLIRSESLAAIGQLVAGTAHEINNPISSASSLVQSSLESLEKMPGQDTAEIIDDLQFSVKELRRAKEIINSLLSLSRQNENYTEPIDIHVAIDDALRVLHNQYKRLDLEIIKNYETGLPQIEGNFANLGQLFINILKNAIQALTDGQGKITIGTRFLKDSESVMVQIRDQGRGIPPEVIKDIFKPFFTTKEVGQGTGLGLYISHEIVKKHRGEISVRSEVGRGTAFTIEIPCMPRA